MGLSYEDMEVGKTYEVGSHTFARDEVVRFAEQFDPQPFHVSDAGAAASPYGTLIASGWHTCSVMMGMLVRNMLAGSTSMGSPGIDDLRWLKPVYAGDTLTLKHRILESRPMRKRADVGLVRSVWAMFNQKGEQVMQMEGYGMFRRREPASAEELARLQASD